MYVFLGFVKVLRLGVFDEFMLLIPCIVPQLTHHPTYAINKIQFMRSNKHLHVSAPGCHPQGGFFFRTNEYEPNTLI
jgi:hypothetical protein